MDKKQKTPNPPTREELGESDTLLNSFSNLLYGNKIGISTLKAIAAGPYPRVIAVLAKVRLVDMGVRI
jgi:hypothetical protein